MTPSRLFQHHSISRRFNLWDFACLILKDF
jgi:hypothetical protein